MQPSTRASAVAIIALSFAAGAMDAFAFLSLGGVFTSIMTGNLVISGLFQRPDHLATVIGIATAVVLFIISVAIGYRVTTPAPGRNSFRRWFMLLLATFVLAVIVAVVWAFVHSSATLAVQCIVLALSASAMGFQSVVAKRAFASTGFSTTYMTGNITSLVGDIVEGNARQTQLVRALGIVAVIVGSVSSAALMLLVPVLGAAAPLVGMVVSLIALRGLVQRSAVPQSAS